MVPSDPILDEAVKDGTPVRVGYAAFGQEDIG
jgi:hypothetical protein